MIPTTILEEPEDGGSQLHLHIGKTSSLEDRHLEY